MMNAFSFPRFVPLSRRAVLAGGLGAIAALAPSGVVLAQSRGGASVDVNELAKPGPLGDRSLGKADAPVTIIEYASLTCGHCANFHEQGFAALKQNYIETGKVRLIFRDFPLDPLATAAAMLARCSSEQRFFPLVDVFFKQQRSWAVSDKPLDGLLSIARQAGFTQETFEACLKNQSVYDGINDVKRRAAEQFGVNSTPTFFINGQIQRGDLTPKMLDDLIAPLLR